MSDRDEQDETDREDTLYPKFIPTQKPRSAWSINFGYKVLVSYEILRNLVVLSKNRPKRLYTLRFDVKNVKSEGKNFS